MLCVYLQAQKCNDVCCVSGVCDCALMCMSGVCDVCGLSVKGHQMCVHGVLMFGKV
jgi:hypothetical protein